MGVLDNYECEGQYSLFDSLESSPYHFERYVGQKVRDSHGEHIIKEIERYYTIYTDGMVGTPHDIMPVDDKERLEAIEDSLRKNELQAQSKDDTNRTIAKGNLKVLYKLRDELKQKLEKPQEEPKAPIWHSSLTACYVECPSCHEINHIENYHDRCPDCGQLLDQSPEAIAKVEKVSKDLQECRKKGLHGAVTKNAKGQWE